MREKNVVRPFLSVVFLTAAVFAAEIIAERRFGVFPADATELATILDPVAPGRPWLYEADFVSRLTTCSVEIWPAVLPTGE